MAYQGTNLFAELTANGNTAAYTLPGSSDAHTVRVYLQDAANDGGGTLKMQQSVDGTNWVDVTSASWTSGDNYLGEYTVFGQSIRFNLASSTSPSGMIVQVEAVAKSPAMKKSFTGITDNTATLGAADYEFLLPWKPAKAIVNATGTFDSGVVKLQQSADGGTTWYDVNSTGVSAAGGEESDQIGSGSLYRVEVVSVAGAAADLDVTVIAA